MNKFNLELAKYRKRLENLRGSNQIIYYSGSAIDDMVKKGYDLIYNDEKGSSFHWESAQEYAIKMRKKGYFSSAGATRSVVYDYPDFFVFVKRRKSEN